MVKIGLWRDICKGAVTSLRQWEARVFRIWQTAVKLCAVPLRTDGVQQPTPAQILVDYKTPEVSIDTLCIGLNIKLCQKDSCLT